MSDSKRDIRAWTRRQSASLLLGLVLVFGATGTAWAHHISVANAGSSAWSSHPHSTACVQDLAADGFSARVQYYRLGSGTQYSVTETGGQWESRCSGSGNTVSLLRACTVKPLYPDACTNWVG